MTGATDQTTLLLEHWWDGDTAARDELLVRDLDWIRRYVHHRLGDGLRRFCETGDVVQEAVLRILDYRPRFRVENRAQWLGLIGRITLNVIRGQHRGHHALKVDPERLTAMTSASRIERDGRRGSVLRPDAEAAAVEELEHLRTALLVLEPGDQIILDLHFQGLTDAQIGAKVDMNGNAVRTRRSRAIRKLFGLTEAVRSGEIGRRFEAEGQAIAAPDRAGS
ncbi:MAG: sigma-70 family RNA polymerase sigma factor [Planctomycetes bacterium]|nr:sigma-70 family RNA polymerase sigma factor [Planctomycetota bacterium]